MGTYRFPGRKALDAAAGLANKIIDGRFDNKVKEIRKKLESEIDTNEYLAGRFKSELLL